nr:sialidase family protein [Haloferax sp. ATB1]
MYASFDGGQNWSFLSQIDGSEKYRMLCPSPVLLDDGTLVAAVRCKISVDCEWTEIYRSTDDGRNWSFVSRVNDLGAPSKLLAYDGSLVCIYGYRHPPYGIRARVSHDDGATWSREWILRDDGANYDLGYPRAAVLDDGTILATYYFNKRDDDVAVDGGPRHIAATRFDPTELLAER